MLCPACRDQRLHEQCAKSGLLFAFCKQCKGVWLDGGELYLLSRAPREARDQMTFVFLEFVEV